MDVDAKKKLFAERIESESMAVGRVSNDDLVCKDCIHRFDDSKIFGNTSRCGVYPSKPNKVIVGESCEQYQKEV